MLFLTHCIHSKISLVILVLSSLYSMFLIRIIFIFIKSLTNQLNHIFIFNADLYCIVSKFFQMYKLMYKSVYFYVVLYA